MAKRIRERLVPAGCVECFEVRVVSYFDADGDVYVNVGISDPDDKAARPPLQEVEGVLWRGLNQVAGLYEAGE